MPITPNPMTATSAGTSAGAPAGGGSSSDAIRDLIQGIFGGGGDFNADNFGRILDDLFAQQDAANAANEARYQEILSGYDSMLGDVDSMLSDVGRSGTDRINQQFSGLKSQVGQDMVSRGLTGTTIQPTMEMGVERQKQYAVNDLNDRLLQQRANAHTAIRSQMLQFMERREDEGPDMGMILGLAQLFGQAQSAANAEEEFQRMEENRPWDERYPNPYAPGTWEHDFWELQNRGQRRRNAPAIGIGASRPRSSGRDLWTTP